MRAPLGGGRLLFGCGVSGVGRSPTPDRPSLGRAARASYPLALDAGGLGLGTCPHPRSARPCVLALRALGAAGGRLKIEGASCLLVGCPEFGALPHPSTRPWGVRPGPATHWL